MHEKGPGCLSAFLFALIGIRPSGYDGTTIHHQCGGITEAAYPKTQGQPSSKDVIKAINGHECRRGKAGCSAIVEQ